MSKQAKYTHQQPPLSKNDYPWPLKSCEDLEHYKSAHGIYMSDDGTPESQLDIRETCEAVRKLGAGKN